ncbi:hypothetical protein [Brevibacterium sp. K72]|uniref:hypothetical protein n=1 Tax=Brevibacterium sp. K72 TaxID=3390729 RepID=UPI003D301546
MTTPVKGYTGTVAGVVFSDGQGRTDDPAALAYFERHGYRLTDEEPEPTGDADSTDDDETGTDETPATGDADAPLDAADTDDDGDSDEEEHTGPAVKPSGNSSRQAWRDYALATGRSEEELEGLNRNEIRELVDN